MPTGSASSEAYRFLDVLPGLAAVVDPACRIVFANQAWREHHEARKGPLAYETSFVYFDEHDPLFSPGCREASTAIEGVREVVRGRRPRFEIEHPSDPNGKRARWSRLTAISVPSGAPPVVLLLSEDVTTRRGKGDDLEMMELGLERVSDFCLWLDATARVMFANDRLCRVLAYTRKELLTRSIWDLDPHFQETEWQEHLRELRELGSLVFRSSLRTKEGVTFPVEVTSNYAQIGGQEMCFVSSREPTPEPSSGSFRFKQKVAERTSELSESNTQLQQEIESRQRTEGALRESQERLELALWGANQGLWDWDVLTGAWTVDPSWTDLLGYQEGELDPSLEGWLGLVHPDDEVALRRSLQEHLRGSTESFEIAHRLNHESGEYRWYLVRGRVVARESGGTARRVTGTLQDITGRKRLEDQLLQSQKMEAVGQLAGGVAHDFNNLLTAINGYADLVLRELDGGTSLATKVGEIRRAGDRAAGLTDRLLAFSRKKMLQPEVLRVNDIVGSMQALLGPAVGEGVEVVVDLGEDLPSIKADLGQMEQALLNLVVNARDAMPRGGRLRIGTSPASSSEVRRLVSPEGTADDYVKISIEDTGGGISPEHLERVFEPFFTTKDPGQGTGLGLSMVYGVVRQSGGVVDLKSELGSGTRVDIYLPAVQSSAATRELESFTRPGDLRGSEHILLVEDEESVRSLVRTSLIAEGYAVEMTASAEEALDLIELAGEQALPDLLLTDVVLPGKNGAELATAARLVVPEIKVLFVSGYARDALGRAQILDEGADFLQKPFTLDRLLSRVRSLLDRAQVGAAG